MTGTFRLLWLSITTKAGDVDDDKRRETRQLSPTSPPPSLPPIKVNSTVQLSGDWLWFFVAFPHKLTEKNITLNLNQNSVIWCNVITARDCYVSRYADSAVTSLTSSHILHLNYKLITLQPSSVPPSRTTDDTQYSDIRTGRTDSVTTNIRVW